jgi:Grx4 family monothiol glutaredoxin
VRQRTTLFVRGACTQPACGTQEAVESDSRRSGGQPGRLVRNSLRAFTVVAGSRRSSSAIEKYAEKRGETRPVAEQPAVSRRAGHCSRPRLFSTAAAARPFRPAAAAPFPCRVSPAHPTVEGGGRASHKDGRAEAQPLLPLQAVGHDPAAPPMASELAAPAAELPLHGDVASEAELTDLFARHARLVLNFWAPWASPCVQMNSVFDALATVSAAVDAHAAAAVPRFVRVPAEELPAVAAEHRVSSVPTFVLVHAGRVVGRVEGANPPLLAEKVAWLAAASVADLEKAALVEVTQEDQVMLFMKGSPDSPSCGFSRQIVDVLRRSGIVFGHRDILKDPEVREGLKKLHNWPTYPQLYARGRLVGGLDIVRELADREQLVAELAREEGDSLPVAGNPGSTSEPAAAPVRSGAGADVAATAYASTAAAAPTPAANGTNRPAATVTAQQPPTEELNERLRELVKRSRVMLFMKGSPDAPQCGFSKRIVSLLRQHDVAFDAFDILADAAVRQGLKDLFKWPTYPQLYSDGELIGGLDIVQGLVEDGALRDELST